MGQAKNALMENEKDENIVEFIEELSKQDAFTGALNDIAKQVLDKGVGSLKTRQGEVVKRFVTTYKRRNVCEVCANGNVSSLTDYISIAKNKICPLCEYDKEKAISDEKPTVK